MGAANFYGVTFTHVLVCVSRDRIVYRCWLPRRRILARDTSVPVIRSKRDSVRADINLVGVPAMRIMPETKPPLQNRKGLKPTVC